MQSERALLSIGLPALLFLLAASCNKPLPVPAAAQLPVYSGAPAALFDDAIELRSTAFALHPGLPDNPRSLRDRTLLGDRVVRARIVTVTSEQTDNGAGWRIGLHTVESLTRGAADADFNLEVAGTVPAAGVLRALEVHLVGRTVLAFLRAFVGPGGTAVLHFHLVEAGDEELRAARMASVLRDVR